MKISKNPTTKAIIPELRGSLGIIRYPAFVELKYDGEATIIMYDITWPDKIASTNKYGTMRTEWSKLDEIAEILESKGVVKAMFLGEIFFEEGKAGNLYDLLSHKEDDNLNIKIYDCVHIINGTNMKAGDTPLIDRKEILADLFFNTPFLVKLHIVHSKQEATNYFELGTKAGFEGIVVKNLDGRLVNGPCDWVKMKKKDQTDYIVQAIDSTKERIIIGVPIPSGKTVQSPTGIILIEKMVTVGVKVSDKIKKTLKIGDIVTIEHQGILDSGSLRHPVFIKKVMK